MEEMRYFEILLLKRQTPKLINGKLEWCYENKEDDEFMKSSNDNFKKPQKDANAT